MIEDENDQNSAGNTNLLDDKEASSISSDLNGNERPKRLVKKVDRLGYV